MDATCSLQQFDGELQDVCVSIWQTVTLSVDFTRQARRRTKLFETTGRNKVPEVARAVETPAASELCPVTKNNRRRGGSGNQSTSTTTSPRRVDVCDRMCSQRTHAAVRHAVTDQHRSCRVR